MAVNYSSGGAHGVWVNVQHFYTCQ